MQWIWKTWEQFPQTNGQSSPGKEQSGQQASNAIRQIPQFSSFAIHFQTATPSQPSKKIKVYNKEVIQYEEAGTSKIKNFDLK